MAQIARGVLARADRELVRELLLRGPWLWPREEDGLRMRLCADVTGHESPVVVPGAVLLVAVGDECDSLWSFGIPETPCHAQRLALGQAAKDAWNAAGPLLSRVLPVLWRSVHDTATGPVEADCLVVRAAPGIVGAPVPSSIDGRSFGLPLFLALASRVFGVPVPIDLAATGCLGPGGAVESVGGLSRKVDLVATEAPRIGRFLVPGGQEEDAETAGRGRLEVIGVTSVAQAMGIVFGEELERQLLRGGEDPAVREALVTSFFHLAIGERGAIVDWTPVERAAATALAGWGEQLLSDDMKYRLRFAGAVAARHENNRGEIDLPPPGWLEQWPAPTRCRIVAHLVQHSADTAMPEAERAKQLAEHHLPAGDLRTAIRAAFGEQLRVAGALGRLEAVTGQEQAALARQREIALAHAAALAWENISYPLCEWFRLAGALRDAASFAECEDLLSRTIAEGALPPDGGWYVTLARCRGRILLNPERLTDPEIVGALASLATDLRIPAHVRWSAARWHVRCLDALRDRTCTDDVIGILDEASHGAGNDALQASVYRTLIDLDRGLAAVDTVAINDALCALRLLEPGIVGEHMRACDARYVARFYPY